MCKGYVVFNTYFNLLINTHTLYSSVLPQLNSNQFNNLTLHFAARFASL